MKALNHTQVHLLIEKAADGLLSADEQRALESHLKGCADCRAYAAEFAALESVLGETLLSRWGQPKLSKGGEAKLVKVLQEKFSPGAGGAPKPPGGFPILLILLGIGIVGLISLGLFWIANATGGAEPSAAPTQTATSTSTATISGEIVLPSETSTPTVWVLLAVPQQNVNCREGNGSAFEIADTLFEAEKYSPTGRGFDNLWVRFMGPVTQVNCWAFVDNLVLEINGEPAPIDEIPESLLPFVNYPPTSTPSPTVTFTPEPDRTETSTPSTPQCSDGKDNDGDGAIDGRDKQCTSPTDNNESS
jgi:hypothetical protein